MRTLISLGFVAILGGCASMPDSETHVSPGVLEDGSTANFKVESASADVFAEAAVAALKLWCFAPPTLVGEPIRISTRQSFPFDAR